jgi:hypothetical protein
MIYKREEHPELYDKVLKDLEHYIVNTVGKPNATFNGMPPCPFAKAEWLKSKVDVVICDVVESIYESEEGDEAPLDEIIDLMHKFNTEFNENKTKSTLILVDSFNVLEGLKYEVGEGVDLAYDLEYVYKQKYPYKTKADSLDILTSNPEEPVVWGELTPYFSIIVQNSSFLEKAIKVLNKAGYYSNLSKDDIVEGVADDPVYAGIKFTDGEGKGDDIHRVIEEDNNLYDTLNNLD